RLLSASDGNTALEIARAVRPDLLLLDWNMPGRDGLEVCRALRAEPDPDLRDVPVVLLTAQVEAEDTAAGFAAPGTDHGDQAIQPNAHPRARSRVAHAKARGRRGHVSHGVAFSCKSAHPVVAACPSRSHPGFGANALHKPGRAPAQKGTGARAGHAAIPP